MRLTSLFALAVTLATCSVSAQTIVTTTKPLTAIWLPIDFASFEVRLTGRKATDAATANKIIGRIALKTLDFSMLTQRVTIMVPANEVWEVKGLTMHFVPANTTGLKPFDIALLDFASSFFPPPGQVLAIDMDAKSGNLMMGPVTVVVVQPPVVVPPVSVPPVVVPAPTAVSAQGDCVGNILADPGRGCVTLVSQLVDAAKAAWTLAGTRVMRGTVDMAVPYTDTNFIYFWNGNVRANSVSRGYICFGTGWNQGC